MIRTIWRRHKRVLIAVVIIGLIVADVIGPLRVKSVRIELKPERLGALGPLPITNTLVASWLATVVLVALALAVRRNLRDAPRARSLQNAVEAILEALYHFLESFAGPRTAVFFPIVGTFFLFILVANWGSLMPGVGSIGLWRSGHEGVVFVPLLRGPTTDLNATLALAICSVVAAQVYSIRQHGLGGHLNRYLPLGRLMSAVRRRGGPGQPSPAALLLGGVLDLFVGALEAFEELTKILSFSFRLFGNVFGGEVLLAVMAYLLPYLVSIPFLALEAFGGFIQAFIFAVLSTAFLARATAAHGGERQEPLANAEETAKI